MDHDHVDVLLDRDRRLMEIEGGLTPEPLERPTALRVGDLVLDPASRSVRRGRTPIALPAKEFALLQELMRRAG